MPDLTDEELNTLIKLWAEAYLRLKEIGEILLKKQPPKKSLSQELGIGGLELHAVKRDKHGKIVHRQDITFGPDGEVKEKKRWDKEDE